MRAVAEFVQLDASPEQQAVRPTSRSTVAWLQGITLVWMLVECAVALYAAIKARSPTLLAFGADSVVELASATVVLVQFVPSLRISQRRSARAAALLLYLLAAVVTGIALISLVRGHRPETSGAGIAITIAALIAMPVLAALKRREAWRSGNAALAADAVQSATCAYLAFTALTGLTINALWHVSWVDPAAALVAVPILIREGRSAWQGQTCGCCD